MKPSYSTFQISPAGISSAAAFYGINSVAPESAKILKLGSGDGFDLINYAVANPLCSIVGIDIDPKNISKGQQNLLTFGVENLYLYCLGLPDLFSIDPGHFDYIIIDEIFSLLDNDTCSLLLDFCERHLTPQGMLAIRWNSLPGSQNTHILRDAIALHSQHAISAEEKISSAKAMLAYMDIAHSTGELKKSIKETLALSDTELAIRFIYNNNDARYLTDFNNEIEKSNLKYVGDVIPQYEMAQYYSENISLVHTVATESLDKIATQQYLDFAVNRHMRFSLVISNNNPTEMFEYPQINDIESLHWAGNYQRKIDSQTYYNRQGASLKSDNELLCRILDVIGDSWPLSVSTSQIVKITLLPDEPDNHFEAVIKALSALYLKNAPGIYITLSSSPYNKSNFGNLKLIYKLSDEVWLDTDQIVLNNLWGEQCVLTRNELSFIDSGLCITDSQEYSVAMNLASNGLLTGSDIAWLRLYQQSMALLDVDIVRRRISSLMLFSLDVKNGGFRKEHISNKNHNKKNIIAHQKLEKAKRLYISGNVQQCFKMFDEMLITYPESIELINDAANFYYQSLNYDEALKLLFRGVSLNSQCIDFYYHIALCLSMKQDYFYPIKIAYYLLRIDFRSGVAWDLLATIYGELHNSLKYEYCAQKAVESSSNNSAYHMRLGTVLSERGQMTDAMKHLRKGVQLSESTNGFFNNYSNLLFTILHNDKYSTSEILEEHKQFGKKVSQWAKSKLVMLMQPTVERIHQRLRIGFISGDFKNHPVSHFIYPIFSSINKMKFDVVGYNTSPTKDSHTEIYSSLSTNWNEVQSLSFIELANKIISDEIDILIDLSGHTAYNRLPTFGLKPAPVQMSWAGYPGTTGLNEIDYYIIGSELAGTGLFDENLTEKVASFPTVKMFERSEFSGEINTLPALDNGYITFGSFNRPQKITSIVLDCWGKILTCLPKAKLLLGSMSDQGMIDEFTRELEERGVKRQQIIPRLKVGFAEYLHMHNEIDMLLDTFPYTAGTTACHAYGMGVPVLTCTGNSLVSCQASFIMRYLELPDFVANTNEDYITKAVEFDKKYEYLNTIRLSMRERLKDIESRVETPAWYFEKMLEAAWERYVQGLPPESIIISAS